MSTRLKRIWLWIRYAYIVRVYKKMPAAVQEQVDEDVRVGNYGNLLEAFRKKIFRNIFYMRLGEGRCSKICRVLAPPAPQVEIYKNDGIGKGLKIYHTQGCTLNAKSIGDYVSISQNVTLGKGKITANGSKPTIGNHVWICTNAVVIGGITVGDYATVGACALVLDDVPPYAVVGGVPAKILYIKNPEEHH